MRRLLILIITAMGFFAGIQPSIAEENTSEIQEIVDRVDKLYRSDTSYGELEMTIVTPNWKRQLRMKLWTEKLDETFPYLTSPKRDAGIATRRIRTER